MAGELAIPEGREPWQKLGDEPMKAWRWFLMYLNMPRRSLRELAAILKEAGEAKDAFAQLARYSSLYHWQRRVELQDIIRYEQNQRDRERELREMRRTEEAAGSMLIAAGFDRMRGRGEPGQPEYVPPLNLADATAGDVVALIREGTRQVRLSKGQPTDLIRGALLVHGPVVTRLVGDIIEIFLPYVPEERQALAIMEVHRYVEGGN